MPSRPGHFRPYRSSSFLRGASLIVAFVVVASTHAFADPLRGGNELAQFRMLAESGLEPWADANERLIVDAQRSWRWGMPVGRFVTHADERGRKACHPEGEPELADFIKNGASDVYARALALRTTDPERVDREVFEARMLLLALASTWGFEGLEGKIFSGDNQCVLDLATAVPVWITSAEMLQESGAFTPADRATFSVWLEREVYPLVAWAGRVRRNNWGTAGSLSARMIARYVEDVRPVLIEYAPVQRVLFARDAVGEHDRMQLDRMGTEWAGDSRCSVHGIQPHGGIPDELRRGAGGCHASELPSRWDAGLGYQTMHVALLTLHAEVLRLEGDASLYEIRTDAGDPALLQSMLFVIDNPEGGASWDWGARTGGLRAAHRYYGDPRLAAQIEANAHLGFRGGRIFPYTQIHPVSLESCDADDMTSGTGSRTMCGIEDEIEFSGMAQGGSVQVVLSGVTVLIGTNPGQSAATVASKVSDIINVTPSLIAADVSSVGIGAWVVSDGVFDSATSMDPGIAVPEPGVGSLFVAGVCGLAILDARRRRRRATLGPRRHRGWTFGV